MSENHIPKMVLVHTGTNYREDSECITVLVQFRGVMPKVMELWPAFEKQINEGITLYAYPGVKEEMSIATKLELAIVEDKLSLERAKRKQLEEELNFYKNKLAAFASKL